MVDIINEFEQWLNGDKEFALATVIRTWRSAPRTEGASMMVSKDGTMIGSVSGGCVESAVVKEAQQLLEDGAIGKRLAFGVSNEDAWSVGLSCGGKIEIWLQVIRDESPWRGIVEDVRSGQGMVLISGLEEKEGTNVVLKEGNAEEQLADDLLKASGLAYTQHKTQVWENYFLNVFPARSRLIMIGAAHVTLDLLKLAKIYDFETIVIDPRGIFTNDERFEYRPDQLYTDWPAEILPELKLDADSYVVVLTHDPKIDDQALKIVLETDVAYIGALGSRKTHAKRMTRLKDSGVSVEQIERIYGPVGLSINARQPSEIALSIMAQIIGVKNQYL